MAQIRVEKVRPVNGTGPLRAFVELRIGQTLFRGFRIVQQNGQKPWVSPPQEQWTDREGKARYSKLIELPKSLQQEVEVAVLRAWGEAEKGKPPDSTEGLDEMGW